MTDEQKQQLVDLVNSIVADAVTKAVAGDTQAQIDAAIASALVTERGRLSAGLKDAVSKESGLLQADIDSLLNPS